MKWMNNKNQLLPLQTGRFRQFWDEAAKNRHIVEAVPGILNHGALILCIVIVR